LALGHGEENVVAIPPLVLKIIADSTGVGKGVAQANSQVNSLKSTMGGVSTALTAGLAVAGIAAVKFGADSVKAFSEAQQVMAQTENVLRSTGGAANVTSKDVLDLASSWQDVSGVQDDAIQSSENLLLTFRDVHNEVGKGNDIFNQATAAILDMSTALNRGAIPSADQLQSSTIQLGKALNDPIAGMTALKRVGVSFSESQIKTIKSLQESGDLMGAQKVILAELRAEFGGAAKAAGDTFAGSVAKLQANINNLQEVIGGLIVERLGPLVEVLSDISQSKLPSTSTAMSIFATALSDVGRFLPGTWSGLTDIGNALGTVSKEVEFSDTRIAEWAREIQQGDLTLSQLRGQLENADASMHSMTVTTDTVSAAVKGLTQDFEATDGPASQFAQSLRDQKKAAQDAAAALRDQRLALLALTDSFLGILDSAKAVADAQDKLNELQKHGKRGTQEYKDAVLDAIAAQSGLETAVFTYAKELSDAGGTQEQVIGKIRNLASNFEGLDKKTLQSLINQVRNYVNELGAIPSFVHTTLDISRAGALNVHAGNRQHGGPVSAFTPYLVGERGPELFVPSTSGQVVANGGGGGGDITLEIDGQAFARISRDQLLKLKGSRVSLGLS
jgi:hypothetical protein